jgi:hypothetical protein
MVEQEAILYAEPVGTSVSMPSIQVAWQHAFASVQAALVAAGPVAPLGAALITVAGFLAPTGLTTGWIPRSDLVLVPVVLDIVIAWAVLAVVWLGLGYTAAERANAGSYNGLSVRLSEIDVRYSSLCSPTPSDPAGAAACRMVHAHRCAIRTALRQPGPCWVLGSGYSTVWERLCLAEQALLLVDTKARIIGEGLYDISRCVGSTMQQQVELTQRATNAIAVLGRGTPQPDLPLSPQDEAGAREDLCLVRRAIDEFRWQRFAGLIRARNHLGLVTALTGLTMYALLWLAMALGSQREVIGVATAYYLIGSTVGFLNQLYNEASRPTAAAVDDYGLSLARLTVTPLLSGLAAVGGVLIVAMLSLTQTGSVGAQDTQPLVRFLELNSHPLNVLVAATFGLTPGQLIGRLRQQGDQYKTDLQRSRAATGTPRVASPTEG